LWEQMRRNRGQRIAAMPLVVFVFSAPTMPGISPRAIFHRWLGIRIRRVADLARGVRTTWVLPATIHHDRREYRGAANSRTCRAAHAKRLLAQRDAARRGAEIVRPAVRNTGATSVACRVVARSAIQFRHAFGGQIAPSARTALVLEAAERQQHRWDARRVSRISAR
jgi:hypothetical protein